MPQVLAVESWQLFNINSLVLTTQMSPAEFDSFKTACAASHTLTPLLILLINVYVPLEHEKQHVRFFFQPRYEGL